MQLIPRHIRSQIVQALGDARVVCLLGARQAGKSTLIRSIADNEHPAQYLTLDDPATLALAREDPVGFLAGTERVAIDEVQRAPDLLLAIKRIVDTDPARGRFLLTGSANIVTHPRVADALPGRVDYLTLWPLSQEELRQSKSTFLENAFTGKTPTAGQPPIGRVGYAERIVKGGFPESVHADANRRAAFFDGYVGSILGREIDELVLVRDTEAAARVLRLAAARTAALTNLSSIARDLGIDHKTVGARLRSLEQLFMVLQLPAWHANLGHRVIRTPKLHIADSGLLCSLIGADEQRLVEDGELAGSVFETFAVTEIVRQASVGNLWPKALPHHYRDQAGNEVDLVMERASGEVIGVEVKASANPRPSRDASGLRLLRDKLGDRFRHGLLLHLGPDSIPIGERIAAVPLAAIWESGGAR
jgi:predicted AAA+ superfamily ATPase